MTPYRRGDVAHFEAKDAEQYLKAGVAEETKAVKPNENKAQRPGTDK